MSFRRSADVCVVGGGVIGRAAALALCERGVRVDLVSRDIPGSSSRAAAGLLAPSIEGGSGAAHDFAVAARNAWPAFLERLLTYDRTPVEFSRDGILDVALTPQDEERLRTRAQETGLPWLAPNEIRALEPHLAPARGGLRAEHDGYVDNVALMLALERSTLALRPRLREVSGLVQRAELARDAATLVLEAGERISSGAMVLAAGAWSSTITGLPRPLPVRPLKGQMLRFDPAAAGSTTTLRHALYGAGVYLVPRGVQILAGATSEEAGYSLEITAAAAHDLATGAKALLPALAPLAAAGQWAGLRPMSADTLPFIGPDPDCPALIYACGHSRNGILKAPLTADCIASLFLGEACGLDLSPFDPTREIPPVASA